MLLIGKSPFIPLFQRGRLKVSLCKGRFRGILKRASRDFDVALHFLGCSLSSKPPSAQSPFALPRRYLLRTLPAGAVEMGVMHTGAVSGSIPSVLFTDLPFYYEDRAHWHRAIDSNAGKVLKHDFEKKDCQFLVLLFSGIPVSFALGLFGVFGFYLRFSGTVSETPQTRFGEPLPRNRNLAELSGRSQRGRNTSKSDGNRWTSSITTNPRHSPSVNSGVESASRVAARSRSKKWTFRYFLEIIRASVVLPVCRPPKRTVTGDSFRRRSTYCSNLGRGIKCSIFLFYMRIFNIVKRLKTCLSRPGTEHLTFP